MQDDITRGVAASIEPQVLAAEGLRALSRSAGDLGAWEMVTQAQAHFWRMTPADSEAAIGLLRRASAAYPDYAPAHSLLGFCLVIGVHMGWVTRDGVGSRPCAARDRASRGAAAGPRCVARLGRTGEARALLATIKQSQPELTPAWLAANVPYQTPELTERYLDGMRNAGLTD